MIDQWLLNNYKLINKNIYYFCYFLSITSLILAFNKMEIK